MSSSIVSQLSGGPLTSHSQQLAHAAANGQIGPALASVPGNLRGVAAHASLTGFVDGLNTILLIGAILAFAGAVATVVLIRQRDFVAAAEPSGQQDPDTIAQAVAA